MSAILESLLSTINLEREPGEANKDFAQRIYSTVKEVDEDTWNKIGEESEAVQEWFNSYHNALKEGRKALPLVPGMANGADPEEASQEPEKKAKRRVSPNKRSGEVTVLIRKAVFRNLTRTAKDIQSEVMEKGHDVKLSTISTTRASFVGCLQTLAMLGAYKHPELDSLKSNPEQEEDDEAAE